MLLGALDVKKPEKSGSEYYNYKGFFSLVLLGLIDAEYRFLWVDVRSGESTSDAQIFNRSKLREKIKDGTLGLLPPEPLGEGEPDLQYFLLGDDTFALMPWMVKLIREEKIANYRQDLQRQEGYLECTWNPGK